MTFSNNTVRRGGLAAMAAGALFVMGALIPFDEQESRLTILGEGGPLGYLFLTLEGLAYLLLLGGLAGLGVLHAGRYGEVGRIGLRLARFGAIVGAASPLVAIVVGLAFSDTERAWTQTLALLSGVSLLGGLAWLAGVLCLGLATLRARVLTLPWRGLPMVAFAFDMLPLLFLVLALAGIFNLADSLVGGVFPSLKRALWGLAWLLVGYAL